jgi:hypothetical protein
MSLFNTYEAVDEHMYDLECDIIADIFENFFSEGAPNVEETYVSGKAKLLKIKKVTLLSLINNSGCHRIIELLRNFFDATIPII